MCSGKVFHSFAHVVLVAGVWASMAALAEFPAGAEDGLSEFDIRSWERRDGAFPGSIINAIQRTPEGYLWLATDRGLVRFDGIRFKLFSSENTPEFETNVVDCLLVHSDGGLWAGTAAGLLRFRDGTIEEIGIGEAEADLPAISLVEGEGGTVWALLRSGEVVGIADGKAGVAAKPAEGQALRKLIVDRGVVWAVSRTNLRNVNDGKWTRWQSARALGQIDAIASRREGGFWIAGWQVNAGVQIKSVTEGATPARLRLDLDAEGLRVTALLEDRSGRLWAGTSRGAIYCYEPEIGWRMVTPRRLRSFSGISVLYEDHEGSIWAGTFAGILHQIKPRRIAVWSLSRGAQEGISHTVHTVCVSRDGTFWVGTDGAGAYQRREGVFSRFGSEHGLADTTVMAIFEDRKTNLWFGASNGLFRRETGTATALMVPELSGRTVPALFEDRAGDLWIGVAGAVIRKRGEEFETFAGRKLQNYEVRAIAEGREGEMWIGTRGAGLFRWENGQFEKDTRFPRPVVNSLHYDDDGALWIGTFARGLYRIQEEDVRNWTVADGLPSNTIFAVLEDEKTGSLWLSSDEGVFGVKKAALTAYAAGLSAPLAVLHLAASETENWSAGSGQPAAAKGANGHFWFPLGHGVMSFDPATLMLDRPAPPVLLDEVLVDGRERAFSRTEPLRILSGVRRLEFRFTLADLDAPGRLKFRYRLEGWEEEWNDAAGQRTAYYSHLPPGRYRFRVLAGGSLGVWNEMASPLAVQIVPRFWETGWFQVLSALALLGGVGGAVRVIERGKARRKMERLEMQQAMERERHRIAQDLHDDLGAGLTEIMLLGELGRRNDPAEAQGQMVTMTDKARDLAMAMDEVVWMVNPKNDLAPNLASYICDYGREFFRAASARCRVDMADSMPPIPVTAHTRHNLFLAVKEAMNNVAKHSGATEVWLRIHCEQKELLITIEDNGRGMVPGDGGHGNGLHNMRTRLEAIGGRMELESEPARGTTIRFHLPLLN